MSRANRRDGKRTRSRRTKISVLCLLRLVFESCRAESDGSYFFLVSPRAAAAGAATGGGGAEGREVRRRTRRDDERRRRRRRRSRLLAPTATRPAHERSVPALRRGVAQTVATFVLRLSRPTPVVVVALGKIVAVK